MNILPAYNTEAMLRELTNIERDLALLIRLWPNSVDIVNLARGSVDRIRSILLSAALGDVQIEPPAKVAEAPAAPLEAPIVDLSDGMER